MSYGVKPAVRVTRILFSRGENRFVFANGDLFVGIALLLVIFLMRRSKCPNLVCRYFNESANCISAYASVRFVEPFSRNSFPTAVKWFNDRYFSAFTRACSGDVVLFRVCVLLGNCSMNLWRPGQRVYFDCQMMTIGSFGAHYRRSRDGAATPTEVAVSLVADLPTPRDGKGPCSPLPGLNARASKMIAEGSGIPDIVVVTDTSPVVPALKGGVPEGAEVPVLVVDTPDPWRGICMLLTSYRSQFSKACTPSTFLYSLCSKTPLT